MEEMDESKKEERLPVRTLHQFLFEIEREWDRFRRGSLISIATNAVLFVLFVPRYLVVTLKSPGQIDTLIVLGIVALVVYNCYLAYLQHGFYSRWEKRVSLLVEIEDKLLGESNRE